MTDDIKPPTNAEIERLLDEEKDGEPMYAIGILGSTDWDDEQQLIALLDHVDVMLVVHGNSRGAERMMERLAVRRGLSTIAKPCHWHEHDPRTCRCQDVTASYCPAAKQRQADEVLSTLAEIQKLSDWHVQMVVAGRFEGREHRIAEAEAMGMEVVVLVSSKDQVKEME